MTLESARLSLPDLGVPRRGELTLVRVRLARRIRFDDLVGEAAERRSPCLLESASRDSTARFSYLACESDGQLAATGTTVRYTPGGDESATRELHDTDPFDALRDLVGSATIDRTDAGPDAPPFVGGVVASLGYDLRCRLERLPARHGPSGVSDLHAAVYRRGFVFDRRAGVIEAWGALADGESSSEFRDWVRGFVEHASMRARAGRGGASVETRFGATGRARSESSRFGTDAETSIECEGIALSQLSDETARAPQSDFDREAYLAMVERAREYIRAGDIFQVNLAQRFRAPLRGRAIDLYRALRRASPESFCAYFAIGDAVLLSASPERFVRVVGRRVETRPVKGTRPRGADWSSDACEARTLLTSEKDRAELAMIVDLERNDLGRVCIPGTVRVLEDRVLESHACVHHLVSTVVGELRENIDRIDVLRAAFPGGSITGAPKIRAMEIIDELERAPRGPYTGSLACFGFDGTLDSSVLIRTATVADGVVSFHAGGGIVIDSDPEAEYEETLHKVRGWFEALRGDREAPDGPARLDRR